REHTVNEDAGARLRDGLKIMRSRGCAPEDDWPYLPREFAVTPPANAQIDARIYKIGAYHRVNNLLELKQAIAFTRQPVAIGVRVLPSFEDPAVDHTGVVPLQNRDMEALLGGAAILCVGYDDATLQVCFKNSWNPTWGDEGYGYLPYAYFDPRRELVMDQWTA